MAASSNITIDPRSFISLSKELKEIKDVLIEAKTYSESMQGSIHRIEKGGFLDFISKSALQTGKVKDKDPETSTALKKLSNFLDQKVDKTREQKIETPTDKLVQPTIFKSIVQSTHKLVEDITSKSVEEFKKTKHTESNETKDSTLSNTLQSHFKQITNLLSKKSVAVSKAYTPLSTQPEKPLKDVSQINNSIVKQISTLIESIKSNKNDIKSVNIKGDDSNLQKVLKSIEFLKTSKKDEPTKPFEQNNGMFKKLTNVFENLKDVKSKSVDIKFDDSALQKVLKSFAFLGVAKDNTKTASAPNTRNVEVKVADKSNIKPAQTATPELPTKDLKFEKPTTITTKKVVTTASEKNESLLLKKLTTFFEGFKQVNTPTNQTTNNNETSLQKILKSFAVLNPVKSEDTKQTQNKNVVNKPAAPTTINNQTTQNTNLDDTFVQKLLKALDLRYTQKDRETISLKQNKVSEIKDVKVLTDTSKEPQINSSKLKETAIQKPSNVNEPVKLLKKEEAGKVSDQGEGVLKKLTTFLSEFKRAKPESASVDSTKDTNTLQRILKAIEATKPSRREESAKANNQSESTFKALTTFLSDVKTNKVVTSTNIDVKSNDTNIQKILKSIESLKSLRKEDVSKPAEPGEGVFKKLTSYLDNFKVNKTGNKDIDIKKDDTNFQKILKSIEGLKSTKKEEVLKSPEQGDGVFKKLTSYLDNVKTVKPKELNTDVKKDDNSLQKILKSIEFLKPSKKEETVKSPEQSEGVVKKLTSFLNDLKSNKTDTKSVNVKKDDNSLQKILKSIEFLKPSKKEETVKSPEQSDSVVKKLTSYLDTFKGNKTDTKSVDVKKDDNSLQKILKSIEFLKPSKKEEAVKSPEQGDGIFKKLTLFLNDFKSNKTDTKNVNIKTDDNNPQKDLKTIEGLKSSKKETVKSPEQGDSMFKKLTSFLNDFKSGKADVKTISVKKDDTSLQKILKSIDVLKPSKKEEVTKSSDQSEGILKKMSSFLTDVKDNKTKGKIVDIKADDNNLQKVLKSIAFLKNPSEKKTSTSKPKVDNNQDTSNNTKTSFISSGITAVKQKLTDVFLPKPANNEESRSNTKTNTPTNPNIVERINSFKPLNEKQPITGQDSDKIKSLAPVTQKLVEQKPPTLPQPVTVPVVTGTKFSTPLAPVKTEGEAQKELFSKEDVSEKILKTLEHIDRTSKEILKAISGKHAEQVVKSEEKKGKDQPQTSPQSGSPGMSPLDLLDLMPGKLKQRARIFAKKGARAARKVFTKGKSLIAKGGNVLKSAAGKAITAGKTLMSKAASTGVGKTVAKGVTTLKTATGKVLEKGATVAKNVTGKALEVGKGLVGKVANTGVVKNASETIAKGTSAIKNTASTVLEKGGSIAKNVTGKAIEASKGLIGKIAGAGTATAGKSVAAVGQAAATGGMLTKAAGLGAGALKSGGKALGFLGKIAKGAGGAALKLGKAIPGVGGVIGTGLAAYGAYSDIKEINEKVKNGEMTPEEATIAKSKAVGKGIGSAAGSFIPGVGGIVGDLAGGWVGDKIGGAVGGAIVGNKDKKLDSTQGVPEATTTPATDSSTAPVESVATKAENDTTTSTNTTANDASATKGEVSNTQTLPTTPVSTTNIKNNAIKVDPKQSVVTKAVEANTASASQSSSPKEISASSLNTTVEPIPSKESSPTTSAATPTALGGVIKEPSTLWERAKNIGTKALQYSTPIGIASTVGKAVMNKLTPETAPSTNTNQTSPISTPNVATGGADPNSALKQVAEGIAASNSNDKDLASSILKMSEALVSAGLMKTPPIELNNIIQGGNDAPKIDLKKAFSNNNDPIKAVRGEFAV